MKTRKLITLLLALVTLFAVMASAVSCGDDFDGDGWVEKNEKTMKSATYKKFNDERYYSVAVEGTITVTVEIVTESGEIGAEVYRKELPDAPIYSVAIYKNDDGKLVADVVDGGVTQVVEFDSKLTDTFTITSDGDYVIHIKGINHKGSYKFEW